MPETTSVVYRSARLLLGVVVGVIPCLLSVLADGNSPSALSTPLIASAYVSFLALAFIAAVCLVRPAHRLLGAGIVLGLLLTAAYYVSLLVRAAGSFN
jgi:hypothetical protein